MEITLTKLNSLEDAKRGFPVGYEAYGKIDAEPKVGECFYVHFIDPAGCWFKSSTVTEIIDSNTFKTKNSIYKITRKMEITLLQKAYSYATRCHRETNHLYDGQPYEFHLKMVTDVAKDHIHCVNPLYRDQVLAACWAHDTIEDTRQTYNDVKAELGQYVAEIVYALTNDKGKNRKERAGEKYYEGIRSTPYASFVKICDRIANVSHSKNTGSSMYHKYQQEMDEFVKNVCGSISYSDLIDRLKSI